MKQQKFGKQPDELILKKIKKSPNYKDGKFQNLSFTPDLAEGVTYTKVVKEFIFNKSAHTKPMDFLPSSKTNLHQLPHHKNVLIWFGHSSYFLQLDGKKILVDPVFSGSASPIRFTTKSFKGSDVYSVADFPEIDFLFLTHDHWDHLDYKTILQLKSKVKVVITGLGTGAHLRHWGYTNNLIHEKDWNEALDLENGFVVNTTPARHFSGRGFKRNQALWMSFVLKTPNFKIYLGGDSGFDSHFKDIGVKHGPFDLAILECGQYNLNWKYIHMLPEEVIQAAEDLKAMKTIAVHWGKFTLAQHAWNEPIIRVKAKAMEKKFPLLHPKIGELVDLDNKEQNFEEWWKGLS